MGATLPNVLIIYTDQQSRWTLGAYEGMLVRTPHIDALARDGVRFENFFTNSAVCTPSRGCFATGLYPHRHGAYHNDVPLNPDEVTFAHVLAMHGYETGYAGKWHLDTPSRGNRIPRERSMGFADCGAMFNWSPGKSVVESAADPPEFSGDPARGRYMTDWLADKAIEFISRRRSAPFCLMVGIPDPHQPYTVREPYASMFQPKDMPIPATFDEASPPRWARENLEGCGSYHARGDPEGALRRDMASYCGEVACIDENVGRILAALDERGLLDRTLVAFTTDHGDYMGEHGLVGKNRCYEAVYRVPLILHWPGKVPSDSVVRRFVTSVDWKQTLLGLLGLPSTGHEQGRDASPLVLGREVEWDDEAFFHHSHFDFTGVFTPEFELVLARTGEHALFDRVNDPEQTRNLCGDPAHRGVVRELMDRVLAHNRAVGSPAVHTWLEGISG